MTSGPKDAFNYRILDETTHRPWPMPESPWIMTQSWHNLLFAHWPVDPDALRAKIPPHFELDLFDQRAWVAVVPFSMSNVSPRGVPALPWVSAFPELNVRTYVRADGKPGVYFFSLDATNVLAVHAARLCFHLPYFTASIAAEDREGWIHYRSRRTGSRGEPAELVAQYRPIGAARAPEAGTLEYFLTERYCLYTVDRRDRPRRLEIHHPLWSLQPAEAEIRVNTMAEAAGIQLPPAPPLLHFARRQDAVAWGLAMAPAL